MSAFCVFWLASEKLKKKINLAFSQDQIGKLDFTPMLE